MKLKSFIWIVLIWVSACSTPIIGTSTLPVPEETHITPSVSIPPKSTSIQTKPAPPTSTPEISITVQTDGDVFIVGDFNDLIAAIEAANDEAEHPGQDTITLQADLISLFDAHPLGGNDGRSGLPSISSHIKIIANGAIIERAPESQEPFRIFHISETGHLELYGTTLRGGSTTDFPGGGALLNRGIVIMDSCHVYGNNNTALINFNGTMQLINTTVNDNQGTLGGAIFNRNPSFYGGDGLRITNSTIIDNIAASGGGIYNYVGTISLTNTIISGNRDNHGSGNCAGNPIQSNGHNLAGDGSCYLLAPGDIPNTDPLLIPIENDRALPKVYYPHQESPVVDAGDDNICPEQDQLGNPRPAGQHCDIGAIELQP